MQQKDASYYKMNWSAVKNADNVAAFTIFHKHVDKVRLKKAGEFKQFLLSAKRIFSLKRLFIFLSENNIKAYIKTEFIKIVGNLALGINFRHHSQQLVLKRELCTSHRYSGHFDHFCVPFISKFIKSDEWCGQTDVYYSIKVVFACLWFYLGKTLLWRIKADRDKRKHIGADTEIEVEIHADLIKETPQRTRPIWQQWLLFLHQVSCTAKHAYLWFSFEKI